MPAWFLPACAGVIVCTLLTFTRRPDARWRLLAYGALVLAGWVGEQSCIRLYAFYGYAPSWRLFLGDVPLLVALIWPLVILSARDVAEALWPERAAGQPLLVGAIVLWDASLVEVVAVRAGLWSWAEGGYQQVPLIGLFGWAYFAAAAAALLWRAEAAWEAGRQRRAAALLMALVIAAPLLTHGALLLSWWVLLRWILRGELVAGPAVALGIGLLLAAAATRLRRRRRMPPAVAGPRVLAAALFLLLLAGLGTAPALWAHAAVVGLPYLLVTGTGSAAAPAGASPRSRQGTAAAARSPGA